MLKKIHILLIIIFLFFLKSDFLYAESDIFYDNFDFQDLNKWNFNKKSGKIDFNDGFMSLYSSASTFPFVINKINNIIPKDKFFNIKIKFKFSKVGNMGDGIGIGFTGPNSDTFYQFGVWNDLAKKSQFIYNDFNKSSQGNCNDFRNTKDNTGRQYFNLNLDNEWHIFEIEQQNNVSYKVFIDRDITQVPIFVSNNFQCIPQNIWFGNKYAGGSLNWTSLMIDYVEISSLKKNSKIIILPGLGTSWNTEAMVYNKEVLDSDWKMTPFVKNYDGLIKSFETKGLVRDKDFYVWNYDWRKPVSEIETKLDNFINEKIQAGEKVDLVGHSFGGVVARIWSQDHKDNDKLGKVMTLGSPNSGSISAYEAWNGGKIFETTSPASVALNVLVQLHKNKGDTKVEALRNFAPSVKDLLPVFDFIKKNNKIISADKLETKNDFLKNKNLLISSIFDKFKAIIGIGQQTNEWINVADRSVFDKILGVWADGKPISYIKSKDGDGTVLKKSAKFDGDDFETANSGHMDVVNNSIGKIFTELGLGSTVAPVSLINNDLSGGLVFFIGSPADLSVKCDDNTEVKSDEMGFVFIKNNNLNQCRVSVNGTGNGIYHLVTGKTDNEDSWQYFEDEISTGSARVVDVDAKTGKLIPLTNNIDYFYELLKKDADNLLAKDEFKENKNLMAVLESINVKNINALVDKLFLFRKEKKEMLVTNRMIDKVQFILVAENKNITLVEARGIYNKALQSKSLVDAKTRLNSRKNIVPSAFSAVSYQKMEELLAKAGEQLKLNNLGEVTADSILALKLAVEVF